MSKKFNLVRDQEQDGFWPVLGRYVLVLLALACTLIAILVIVFGSTMTGIAISTRERQAEIAEANARLATRQAENAAERAEMAAVQQAAERFRQEGNYSRYHTVALGNAALFDGPNPRYKTIGQVKKGQDLIIIASDNSGSYYLLDSGTWVNSMVIEGDFPALAVLNR